MIASVGFIIFCSKPFIACPGYGYFIMMLFGHKSYSYQLKGKAIVFIFQLKTGRPLALLPEAKPHKDDSR
jgi:hypothetical protein